MERQFKEIVPFIKYKEVSPGEIKHNSFNHHLFSITLKGGAEYSFPEGRAKIRSGDLLSLHPGTLENWTADPEEGWTVYYVIIDLPTRFQLLLPPENLSRGIGRVKLYGTAFDECRKAFEVMDNWWNNSSSLKEPMFLNQIEYLLLQIKNLYNTGLLDSRIEKACSFLNTRINKPTTLDEVAHKACLSKPRLNTLFNEYFGFPPLKYLKNLRMERAAQLLLFTSLDIEAICNDLGYNERKYFDKLFKRHWKVTPYRYRKENQ